MILKEIFRRITQSDIAKRLASGAFWSLTGTAFAKFIVLLAGIVCAHILGKEEYGEFGMVRSTINLFVVFGSAGLGMTAAKYISEYRKSQQAKINKIYAITNRFAIISGTIVTGIIILLSPYIAENTLNAPHLTNPLRVGVLLLFITILNGSQTGCLSGFEDFKSIAINTLIGSVIESILMLLGGYLYGITGAILGYGCGFVTIYICNFFSIRKNFEKYQIKINNINITKEEISILYNFTLPAALSSFLVMPVYWVIRTLLVQKNGFEELAIYEAADQWKTIILFIPSAISGIVLPILSSMSNDKKRSFWKVLKCNVLINSGVATVLAIIVVLMSSIIMRAYGDDYNNPTPLILLALSTIPSSIANVVGVSIASRAKMWVGLIFNLIWATMMILLTYVLLYHDLGASALAIATLVAYTIHSLLQYLYLRLYVLID